MIGPPINGKLPFPFPILYQWLLKGDYPTQCTVHMEMFQVGFLSGQINTMSASLSLVASFSWRE